MKFAYSNNVFYQYNKISKLRWLRVVETIATILVVLIFVGLLSEVTLCKMDQSKYKVKGKLVSLGKHRLMYNTTGTGKATVIFESGIDETIQQWGEVRAELSKEARIFTYERAGYGWSESSPNSAEISEQVKELKSLLKKSAIKAPYILVGHGYGGLVMSKFAKEYPEEVAGLVLIDSLTDKEISSVEFKNNLKKEIIKTGSKKYFSYVGLLRVGEKLKLLKEEKGLFEYLDAEAQDLYRDQRVTSKYNSAVNKELKELMDYKEALQEEGVLGDKPLIVFTTIRQGITETEKSKIVQNQKELLKMSSKADQNIMENIGTYIHLEKPEAIINSVNSIIKKIGK